MTIVLHHLNASRSSRIVWLLEELKDAYGLDYELVRHSRDADTNLAPAALSEVHPLGKAPLLVDDGVVIAESGAIAEYLVAKYDPGHKLHPAVTDPAFPTYLEWVHAAEGSPFLPGLLLFYLMRSELLDHPMAAYVEAERDKAINVVDAHLADNAYFAGDVFTAADCLMGFMLTSAQGSGALEGRTASLSYLKKVAQRPAFERTAALI